MTDLFDRDLNLRNAFFQPLNLTTGEFLALFRQPLTWRYLAVVFVIMVTADPTGLQGHLPFWLFLSVWAVCFGVYMGFQSTLLIALAALRPLVPRPAVYWPIISLLALTPTIILAETILTWGLDGIRLLLFDRIFFVALTTVLFEAIYLRFVLPRLREEIEAKAKAALEKAEQEPPRVIHIGAQPVPLDQLRVIEAREHHVHVRLNGQTLTQRARLSDIVAQTGPEDGVQPHRSWWVARTAARALEREGDKPVLRLGDGTRVPVARGRLSEVESWVADYLG